MKEPCCFSMRQRWRDALPRRFLCFCTLRTGANVIAAISVLYALLLAAAPWTLGLCGYRLCSKIDGGLVGQILAYLAATMLLIAALLMVVGASSGRRELLLPWLGFSAFYIGLWLLAGIIALIFVSVHGAYVMAVAAFFISLNMAEGPSFSRCCRLRQACAPNNVPGKAILRQSTIFLRLLQRTCLQHGQSVFLLLLCCVGCRIS